MRSPASSAAIEVRLQIQRELFRAKGEADAAFSEYQRKHERVLTLERVYVATGVVLERIDSDDLCDCRTEGRP
jgi:hypothetical protein